MSTLLNKSVLLEATDILGRLPLQSSIRSAFRNLYCDLSLLDDLRHEAELDVIANKVHRACGPCAIFGATELVNRLSELEQHLRTRRTQFVPQMVKETRAIAEATEYELKFQTGGVLEQTILTLRRKRAPI